MAYGETKVYFDGSHYIAIPHTERKLKRRPKPPEEVITVKDIPKETVTENAEENVVANAENAAVSTVESTVKQVVEQTATSPQKAVQSLKTERKMTKKELFDELYKANVGVSKAKRRKNIVAAMRQYFDSVEDAELFVDRNLERKQRNLICRRIRMMRKANLADFNYFVTFTYSDALHTEESFRKKLKNKLALLA